MSRWLFGSTGLFPAHAGPAWRCALVALTAFVVSVAFGGWLIRLFQRRRIVEDTTQPDHVGLNAIQSQRKNVPTMGGLMILAGILASLIIWSDLRSPYVWTGVLCVIVLGALGFADDYIKLMKKPSRGLSKKAKLAVQFALGLAVGWLLMGSWRDMDGATAVRLWPGRGVIETGRWYILWAAVLLAAASNAVNLADGLDGLAGGCAVIAGAGICVVAFALRSLHAGFIDPGSARAFNEITVLCAALGGATLGFLWYNCHPAQIFMGDTGSLMLGGVLAYAALALKLDLLLLPLGLVFFVDTLTVALQIASFKLARKRIFPITPIHHYFQVHLKWPDQKITVRAWIIAALAAVVGVALVRMG